MYTRFAIYYLPPAGALADFGARWLGWDVRTGQTTAQPDVPDLDDITVTPRKYGFHGTIKPPFKLEQGRYFEDLKQTVAELAAGCAPANSPAIELTTLGRFLALTPSGDVSGLARVAATFVRGLDMYRAPASKAELKRRRNAGLSPRQDELLRDWGYPYVLEEFRFHLTLSGRLDSDKIEEWRDVLATQLPDLPAPFSMSEIALCGERPDGRFEEIQRYALTG